MGIYSCEADDDDAKVSFFFLLERTHSIQSLLTLQKALRFVVVLLVSGRSFVVVIVHSSTCGSMCSNDGRCWFVRENGRISLFLCFVI
jgi:hypothetical protein